MIKIIDRLFGSSESSKKYSSDISMSSKSAIKEHDIIGAIDSGNYDSKYNKLVTWLRNNEFSVAKKVLRSSNLFEDHRLVVYPAVKGGCFAFGPGCFRDLNENEPIYVIGDTHGDLESLVAMLDTILTTAKINGITEPTVYILGDVLDRNKESCMLESVFILSILQQGFPGEFDQYNNIKLGFIKGDHDIALSYSGGGGYDPNGSFSASVSPADYCDWLNKRIKDHPKEREYTLIGRAWIKLMKECPSAAFIESSGTLLSHGGIPRADIQEQMKNGVPFLMQSEESATDFMWCRMTDSKNKLLNRGSKTSEIGFGEFDSFNKLMGGRIKKFIFGHQHPVKGYMKFNKNYPGYDVICISSFNKEDSLGGPTVPYYCKIEKDDINVYSMRPAKYVVWHEEKTSKTVKVETKSFSPPSKPEFGEQPAPLPVHIPVGGVTPPATSPINNAMPYNGGGYSVY